MRLSKSEMFLLPLALLGTAFLAYEAYRLVGFIGIGVLGLLIGVIAVQVDLEKGGAVGAGSAASLFAQQVSAQQNMSRSERAARHAEIQSMRRPLMIAKIVSAALIIVGIGGFFYFD